MSLAACRAVLFAQLVDGPSSHPDNFPTNQAVKDERERIQQRFKSSGSAQRFLSIQSTTTNTFYIQRHLLNRTTFKPL